MKKIKFIDLFSGIGGFRLGFESACKFLNINSECIFSSEIKKEAVDTYKINFSENNILGDITKIKASEIPNFDVLLAGFPCQSFSSAGSRKGFLDTRGTLFFDIQRILKEKKPKGFILENVEGLISHDRENVKDAIGNTLSTILKILESLNYKVSYSLLNSKNFGLAQDRNRIFIVGTKKNLVSLEGFSKRTAVFGDIMDKGIKVEQTDFAKLLLKKFSPKELLGKSIKDKRGGDDNIHSWDLEIKGKVSKEQKKLLNALLKQRRRKVWAEANDLDWMDGMALSLNQIYSFYCQPNLFEKTLEKKELKLLLDDLVKKGYLSYEHPKFLKKKKHMGGKIFVREEDKTLPKGYNIVVGKLSFEFSKIVDPKGLTPTLVSTDMDRIGIVDSNNIRKLTVNECLRLFGFPKTYKLDLPIRKTYNLFGQSVAIPVVREVSKRLLENI
jgi:DNA (cytosine-5)-methyltransferase 1